MGDCTNKRSPYIKHGDMQYKDHLNVVKWLSNNICEINDLK